MTFLKRDKLLFIELSKANLTPKHSLTKAMVHFFFQKYFISCQRHKKYIKKKKHKCKFLLSPIKMSFWQMHYYYYFGKHFILAKKKSWKCILGSFRGQFYIFKKFKVKMQFGKDLGLKCNFGMFKVTFVISRKIGS